MLKTDPKADGDFEEWVISIVLGLIAGALTYLLADSWITGIVISITSAIVLKTSRISWILMIPFVIMHDYKNGYRNEE